MRPGIGRRSPAPNAAPPEGAIERARAVMVAEHLANRGIRDDRVLEAMASTPRELFVPNVPPSVAYGDRALPIDSGQTISQPYIVARMTELLRITPGDRILEIGTGSGYQAAVLARLGARVTTMERHRHLAEMARARLDDLEIRGVDIHVGDGSRGAPDGAPWDGIVVTAAAPSIPQELREQLKAGGRLVIPVGSLDQQDLRVIERHGQSDWTEWSDGAVVFVPLVGDGGWSEGRAGEG